MNILCNVYGGGIFSKLMLVFQNVILRINQVDDIECIVIKNCDDRILNDINPFDYIYQQPEVGIDIIINCKSIPVYQKNIPDEDLVKLRKLCSKLIVQDKIIENFNKIKKDIPVDADCLGVHIRLTDMNFHHPEYGIFMLNSYVEKINDEIRINDYSKIFIASDNTESILKLKEIYGDKILYHSDFLRVEKEDGDMMSLILSNFSERALWEDTFIEMLLLSECGALIQRVSNFPNMTKIYSKSINKVILL